jgi:lysophospholipase L1-like esterase
MEEKRMHRCKTGSFVRMLSLLLTVALLAGMLTAAASAASLDNVRHYDVYTCLGDSVAEGFGPDFQDYEGLKRAEHAYHAYVADAVTADTFHPMARPGGSTGEVRFYLDSDYAYNAADFRVPYPEEKALALRAEVQKAVSEADLITLNVGSNDLFTTSLFAVAAVLYADSGIPEDVENMLGNYGELGKAFQSMLVTAEKLGRLPEVLRTFTEKVSEGFQTFRTNWNAICKGIYALNPDVTLVAVGFFNPVKTLRLSSTQPQIGQMMDPIARMMNNFVQYQADYAKQYLYADVYHTECYELVPVDDPTFGSTLVPAVHPTHDGHKYMAEQIVKVLPEKEEPKPCDGGENCPSKAFTDVDRSADSWMHEPIDWAVTNEITKGTSEHAFSPDASCTRAQAVTFLYRLAGEPEVKAAETPFKDVKTDAYYSSAVLWAVEAGVTKGTASDAFSPDKTCTRAEIATFLFRYANAEPLENAENPFSDVPADTWYTDAVLWAADQGIAKGVGGGKFAPGSDCTRAQIVTFLFRAK